MSKSAKKTTLIIVESPAKVKTIARFLGSGYIVKASVGHVRDLPRHRFGIRVDQDFEPEYVNIYGKGKVIRELKECAAKAERILLGPDPDREGEAIGWHLAELLRVVNPNISRILFYELTDHAVKEAVRKPVDLNQHRVEAQQARRILDRIVGYKLSPLLWKKVQRGLSAGRVQSVTLRLVCDRESEIEVFEPKEYWPLTVRLAAEEPPEFAARLMRKGGRKYVIQNAAEAKKMEIFARSASFVVDRVDARKTRRLPKPPFITSTLQQEAAHRFRFTAQRTMKIAQGLYEGKDIGQRGRTGLITYMRTDSVRSSSESLQAARTLIRDTLGPDYIPPKPRIFRSRKGAQDAHEAIRPTYIELRPEDVSAYLDRDELRLYTLIWQRFIACQMAARLIEVTTVTIGAGDLGFETRGEVELFPGFTRIYRETAPDKQGNDKEGVVAATRLPPLKEKDPLILKDLKVEQKFTKPPPRYNEASLVKMMEEKRIGRPSTYAAILTILKTRHYVESIAGYFHPSELGRVVNDMLVASFPKLMDIAFTAHMEEEIEEIERGRIEWHKTVSEFYNSFMPSLERAEQNLTATRDQVEQTDIPCDTCGAPMVIRWGKRGHFLSCSNYPDCATVRDFTRDKSGKIVVATPVTLDRKCPKCCSALVLKSGRFGRFLSCSNYPKCKHTEPYPIGVPCPEPGCNGEILERATKRRRVFYGCNQYPKCKFQSWRKPVAQSCPECGNKWLVEQKTRGRIRLVCPNRACSFSRPVPVEDESESAS